MRARPRQRSASVAGFTLIEALIATALMAMVLTALATITAQWMPNWNHGMARVQRDEDLALGLDRLVADLAAAAFIPAGRQTLKPFFEGTSHSITFVRTALSPNAHPGLEIVRFAQARNSGESDLVRTQAPFTREGDSGREPHFGDPVVLIRTPFRVSFSYAGKDRSWRDAWQSETELPRAVRLTVRDAPTGHTLAASTATLVHVDIPVNCIGAKSFAACLAPRQSPTPSAAAAAMSNVGNPGTPTPDQLQQMQMQQMQSQYRSQQPR